MSDSIIARCEAKGLRMTDQRRTIARVIGAAETIPMSRTCTPAPPPSTRASPLPRSTAPSSCSKRRASSTSWNSATGARAMKTAERDHHDHLIDLTTGEVIEFIDPEIEACRTASRRGWGIGSRATGWNFIAARAA
jgi:Fur family transcriptional regulator, ferric uptake regulator